MLYVIRKITQTAEFTVVTQEQSRLMKPKYTAILVMIPANDSDPITHLIKLLRLNKPETSSRRQFASNHDTFARLRMDFEANTEFIVKLTPKDDKVVYIPNQLRSINLKKWSLNRWNGSDAQVWNHHNTAFFLVRRFHFLRKENPTENYVSLCTSEDSIP